MNMETTQQVKVLTPQEEALQKAKSIAEKQFELTIKEVDSIVAQCMSIKITDATTLSMAEQVLSKANKAFKDAEEKRKAFNRPAADRIEFVNNLVKSKITSPLEGAVSFSKTKLKEWNDAEKARAAAENAENDKRYTYLKALEAQLTGSVNKCDTPKACDDLITSIGAKWPANEKFGAYLEDANKTKANFITFLTTRKAALTAAVSANPGSISSVVEAVKAQEAALVQQAEVSSTMVERKELVSASIVTSKSAVRKTWKFVVVDEMKLPRQFLSLDEKKVREYLAEHKAEFDPNGTEKGGVRFFQDETPVSK